MNTPEDDNALSIVAELDSATASIASAKAHLVSPLENTMRATDLRKAAKPAKREGATPDLHDLAIRVAKVLAAPHRDRALAKCAEAALARTPAAAAKCVDAVGEILKIHGPRTT